MSKPPFFSRSLRSVTNLPQYEIELLAPPPTPSEPGSIMQTLLYTGMFAVVMIGMAMLLETPDLLFFSIPLVLVSSLAAVIYHFWQKRNHKKESEKRERQYKNYLAEREKELQKLRKEQHDILHAKNPSLEQCEEWVSKQKRDLWARHPNDDDFLDLRLGLRERPSTVSVKAPKAKPFEPDLLIEAAQSLASEFQNVPDVPFCLSLRKIGVAGLAGPPRERLRMARALLIHLATTHSPDEVKIVAIYPASEEKEWGWIRWLPHVWSHDRRLRFLANDEETTDQLFTTLNELLNHRRNQLKQLGSHASPSFPFHLVFFLADDSLTENEPLCKRLEAEGAQLGAFTIFLRDKVRLLPPSCVAFVNMNADKWEGKPYLEFKAEHEKPYFFTPDVASRKMATAFAQKIAPIRLKRSASTAIPATISLLELLDVQAVEELGVLTRWQHSQRASRSLAVPIGLSSGNKPLILDLHEREHGPNGLVAGMVGAGKSELLQTLVASLTVNFHPHRMAFVLVDYKGGGMATPFEHLPHTLGMITNLQQGNLAVRALTSFRVEATRRQELFAAAGVNHIDEYQKLYYRGQVQEPLPYLVIIVDEFAEMKTEQPEVAKEFVSIARIGRALGFRLLLAMQKPAGIVDGQIEANTRFRLCLRVAQPEESQAMIKRPDAAFLADIGRAYFQVGVNEIFEQFQVAWSGALYDPQGTTTDNALDIVDIGLDGSRKSLYRPNQGVQPLEITQLKAVTAHLKEVAQQQAIQSLPRLWLPPLPKEIALEEIRPTEGWNGQQWAATKQWLAPVVGLVDNPEQRKQEPLRIPLGQEGHLRLYGAPGYGKTTFIQTLVRSLAMSHPPQEVHIYLLDFGGRFLKIFEPLPQVGAVIVADESERLNRLLRYLLQEMNRRNQRFAHVNMPTLTAYRAHTREKMPAIVVMIDNYANFSEAYEEAQDKIAQIARDGGKVGIYLVLTANSASTIRLKVSSNITMAMALHLVEHAEYQTIIGRTKLIPIAEPGRGIVRGGPALEFQAALPAKGQNDYERSHNLKKSISMMDKAWLGQRAHPIIPLPEKVALCDLLSDKTPVNPVDKNSLPVRLGLKVEDLTPIEIDIRQGPHFLIAGPSRSGKTTLLQTWIIALAEQFSPSRLSIYLIDSRRGGLSPLQTLPHVKMYASEQTQADQVLTEIDQLLLKRQALEESFRNTGDVQGAQHAISSLPAIIVVVDDILDPYDDPTSNNAKQQLKKIAHQARQNGVHLLLASSSSWTEPINTLKEQQTGFMLGSSDDSVFNLRLPHAERQKILKIGEGYWVRHGQSRKVKIATPHAGSLQLRPWVQQIEQRYQNLDSNANS